MQSTFERGVARNSNNRQFLKSSGCQHYVPKIHKFVKKFGRKFLFLKKSCLKINVQDSSFKFWPNFFHVLPIKIALFSQKVLLKKEVKYDVIAALPKPMGKKKL